MNLFGFLKHPKVEDEPQFNRRKFMAYGCACCFSSGGMISQAQAQIPEVQRHLAAARLAAGSDLLPYLKLAEVADESLKNRSALTPKQLMDLPAPPPGKAFDNLYFVGSKWVSCWAITTSEGIILIDAMDNDEEAEHIVDKGMRELGLDPANIKMIVVTHGHGDHYGGVGYLRKRYGPSVHLSEIDWQMMSTQLEFDRPYWGRPLKRESSKDLALKNGDQIQLGNTKIEVLLTPGHTVGTISLLFDVHQGTQVHRALLWGGTAFNFGNRPERIARIDSYIDATARTKEIAAIQNVEVFISNHNGYDEAVEKLDALKAQKGREKNPFVIGAQSTQRALTVMNECAKATKVVWQMPKK
jgi:metallo-beta-lactamase class B